MSCYNSDLLLLVNNEENADFHKKEKNDFGALCMSFGIQCYRKLEKLFCLQRVNVLYGTLLAALSSLVKSVVVIVYMRKIC